MKPKNIRGLAVFLAFAINISAHAFCAGENRQNLQKPKENHKLKLFDVEMLFEIIKNKKNPIPPKIPPNPAQEAKNIKHLPYKLRQKNQRQLELFRKSFQNFTPALSAFFTTTKNDKTKNPTILPFAGVMTKFPLSKKEIMLSMESAGDVFERSLDIVREARKAFMEDDVISAEKILKEIDEIQEKTTKLTKTAKKLKYHKPSQFPQINKQAKYSIIYDLTPTNHATMIDDCVKASKGCHKIAKELLQETISNPKSSPKELIEMISGKLAKLPDMDDIITDIKKITSNFKNAKEASFAFREIVSKYNEFIELETRVNKVIELAINTNNNDILHEYIKKLQTEKLKMIIEDKLKAVVIKHEDLLKPKPAILSDYAQIPKKYSGQKNTKGFLSEKKVGKPSAIIDKKNIPKPSNLAKAGKFLGRVFVFVELLFEQGHKSRITERYENFISELIADEKKQKSRLETMKNFLIIENKTEFYAGDKPVDYKPFYSEAQFNDIQQEMFAEYLLDPQYYRQYYADIEKEILAYNPSKKAEKFISEFSLSELADLLSNNMKEIMTIKPLKYAVKHRVRRSGEKELKYFIDYFSKVYPHKKEPFLAFLKKIIPLPKNKPN